MFTKALLSFAVITPPAPEATVFLPCSSPFGPASTRAFGLGTKQLFEVFLRFLFLILLAELMVIVCEVAI